MSQNTEIILESERLLFRHHVPNDLEAYCTLEQDPLLKVSKTEIGRGRFTIELLP